MSGAAIAAFRIHKACRSIGIDSKFYTDISRSGDWTVKGPVHKVDKIKGLARGHIGNTLTNIMNTTNPILHSPSVLPSKWKNKLNNSIDDIVHLHWIAAEMLSIADIGKIRKPLIWTLHDMWAFCGAEHISNDNRYIDGYRSSNRPEYEKGFDLNRWTWNRKVKHWKKPIQIVTPSNWLAKCARNSSLMRDWPIQVVPNAINTDQWRPINQATARELLGLPRNEQILLFGAMGGAYEHHKGYDLLENAIQHLNGEIENLRLVVFGQSKPKNPPNLGFPVKFMGRIFDQISLCLLYNAADALVIPSRVDNLPNTGVESLACGTPVISFDTCGLPDIVSHKKTGYLAKPFESESLASGIKWVLKQTGNGKQIPSLLSKNARKKSIDQYSYPVISKKYLNIYKKILNDT